jgi:phosphoribosylaminoimidazole-succinocarboxamide synthase
MQPMVLLNTQLPFKLFGKGKVRDTYDLGDKLLMVTTDRLSAFDVVLPNGIPDKGQVLTQLSAFWFHETEHIVPNHLISTNLNEYPPELRAHRNQLAGRSMLIKKAHRINFECVVRGYLAGSAWKEYRQTGMVCGIKLPSGLREADQLPEPIFTPATKAEEGHDLNISLEQMKNHLGEDLGQALADTSLAIFTYAAKLALDKGIIIADTKMEFGLLNHQLILIDELLTPDSSRFWAVGDYAPGQSPPSFDKQFVRDYLERIGWNKQPPAPELPPDVIEGTSQRYREALQWLTGADVSRT